MSVDKLYLTPNSIQKDSYLLASRVVKSGFRPDFMVALWRGGTPVAVHVHEFLKYSNMQTDHIAIRTSRYTGIDETSSEIAVHNLGYLTERLHKDSKVLLVDDVFDSGLSIAAVKVALRKKLADHTPDDIRVACVYYKPLRNKTAMTPDYYVHSTNAWIVFPHELEGMSLEGIAEHRGQIVADALRTPDDVV